MNVKFDQQKTIIPLFHMLVIIIIIGVCLCSMVLENAFIVSLFGCIFIVSILIYNILYRWLNLKRSNFSLLCFIAFVLINVGYIYSFAIIFRGLPTPIYIQELPLVTQNRYTLLTLGVVFGFSIWLLSLYSESVKKFIKIITYPYIQKEVHEILYYWNDTFMGDLCIYLYKKIYNSRSFKVLFFSFHFIIFYIARILFCYYFFKFTFLAADFRPLIYLLPFLFLRWILSFIDYYFTTFRKGTEVFINDMLIITYKKPLAELQIIDNYAICLPSDIKFELTSEGYKEGFDYQDNFQLLVNKWFCCAHVYVP
jgi:hypothetical protein